MSIEKGPGLAHFLVDHGPEHHNEWIVFLDTGEIWSFLNPEVRAQNNVTYGRKNAINQKSKVRKNDCHI